MRRVAVFVDAGYFWARVRSLILNSNEPRDQITLDYHTMREQLMIEINRQFPDVGLLRIYWYDGPGNHGKNADHHAIDLLDDFKLRLGTRNLTGEQKAVDGLIIADMIGLAQTKAISDALLVSGDADLTPGVVAAQGLGLRIHLLSIGSNQSTSPYLAAEADRKWVWPDHIVRGFASRANSIATETTQPPLVIAIAPSSELALVAEKLWEKLHRTNKLPVLGSQMLYRLPQEIDRELLKDAAMKLGRKLVEDEKRELRENFRVLWTTKISKNPLDNQT